jgi:hypothetical protein
MKHLFRSLFLLTLTAPAAFAGTRCVATSGSMQIIFSDSVPVGKLVPVDQKQIVVSRHGEKVDGLVAYLNEDLAKGADFTITQGGTGRSNFHLEVQGKDYRFSVQTEEGAPFVLEEGRMVCLPRN